MCIYLVLLSFPFLTPFHFNVGGLKYITPPPLTPPEKVVFLNEMTWSLRRTTGREGGDIGLKLILNHKAYKLVLLFVGLKTIGSFVIDWEVQTNSPIFSPYNHNFVNLYWRGVISIYRPLSYPLRFLCKTFDGTYLDLKDVFFLH